MKRIKEEIAVMEMGCSCCRREGFCRRMANSSGHVLPVTCRFPPNDMRVQSKVTLKDEHPSREKIKIKSKSQQRVA